MSVKASNKYDFKVCGNPVFNLVSGVTTEV